MAVIIVGLSRHGDETDTGGLHLVAERVCSIEGDKMANALKMLGRSQHGSDVSRVGHGANKKMTQRNLRLRNWSSEQERAVCDPTLTTPTGETRIDGDNSRLAKKVPRLAAFVVTAFVV